MKKTLEQLVKERNFLTKQINEFVDSEYFYYVVVWTYGSGYAHICKNIVLFKELCERYYGDNGFSHGYSNNPKVKRKRIDDGNGCTMRYIQSIENIKEVRHLNEIKQRLDRLKKLKEI